MDYSKLNFDSDDLLFRHDFVKNIMNIIEQWKDIRSENDSLVISLDAPWGSGKSYLLNMWRLLTDEFFTRNLAVIYYNAWENDDCDNAFIPIIAMLEKIDISNKKVLDELKEKAKNILKACGIALLKDGIKKFIGEETAKLIEIGFEKAIEKTETILTSYELFFSEKQKFKNALNNLIPDNGKLIIFVDELDRCRPTFAVETLEIIKHYFDIPNIVFIFATDLDQLSHSIKTMYGTGMDSAGYLRRFFDINLNIPEANIQKYLIERYKANFLNLYLNDSIIFMMENIFEQLKLSLRDIDKLSNNFYIFCLYYIHIINAIRQSRGDPSKIYYVLEIYIYFMTLKYKYPDNYYKILKQNFIAYFDKPQDSWAVLERKYFVSENINMMLKEIQTGKAQNKDYCSSLLEKYCFNTINSEGSFADHIELTLEMFNPI